MGFEFHFIRLPIYLVCYIAHVEYMNDIFSAQLWLIDLSRLPCPVIPVKGPAPDKFDCYVLVCENLEWSNPGWDFLKTPILEAAKVKPPV